MKPKEKAKELVEKFLRYSIRPFTPDGAEPFAEAKFAHIESSKQCALIALEEILNLKTIWFEQSLEEDGSDTIKYWQQVKREIEKV